MRPDYYSVNGLGHLCVENADCVKLASRFETPLYVLSKNCITENCRKIQNALKKYYGKNAKALYASKAFCCKEIYRIISKQGFGADAVSAGEIYTAMSAGFDLKNIYFHGNNKTTVELRFAVENEVGAIVADNISELERLAALAKSADKRVKVLLRLKPGVEAHTHSFIKTGQIDSKFGFAIETGEAKEAFAFALSQKSLYLAGLHCHIGSQIFEITPFEFAAKVMLRFALDMKKEFGYEIDELNLGGGFGISYLPNEAQTQPELFIKSVSAAVLEFCENYNFKKPFICIEPGRSIVGDAGITLYTVGSVKKIPGVRTYISVDGGMTDNPRYILYNSDYEMTVANKADKPKNTVVTIAGRCCESGDLLGENISLQRVKSGDILAVFSTGAYNYSMASNYNRVAKPAVVLVNGENAEIIVKRESYEDLIKNDM